MSTTSKLIISVDETSGLNTVVNVDASIFGTGTLALRPGTGTDSGDMYVVNDTGLSIFRIDLWDGSVWRTLGSVGSFPVPTQTGEVLYACDATAFVQALPVTCDYGWLVNEEGIHIVNG